MGDPVGQVQGDQGGVIIYSSQVSGSAQVKTKTQRVENILIGRGIPYTMIDVSLDENTRAKIMMQQKSGSTAIPQIFVGQDYIGNADTIEEANEEGLLPILLQQIPPHLC